MRLSEAFQAYAEDVIVFTNQSVKTEEYHFNALKSLLLSLGEDIDVSLLTLQMVRAWKADMEKRGLRPITIRGYLSKLRVVLKYLNQQQITSLPYEQIKLPRREASVPNFITENEVAILIDALARPGKGYAEANRRRNQAIISLLYGSGIRISELCSLNRDSIYRGAFTVIGKGRKPRLCFVDQRTQMLLRQYLNFREDDNPALFLANQTGQRIRPGNIQQLMRHAWKKAGLDKPVHPHTLRHSFSTNFLRNNGNMRYLQVLLGHSSLETTQMYASVVDNDLQAVYKKYHSV